MKKIKGHRKSLLLLCPFLLAAGIGAAGYFVKVQVLEIGERGPSFTVRSGEIFSHCFIHSMYNVTVCEKFRIGKKDFMLFNMDSESYAALEYYGIDNRKENNVSGRFTEMIIPAESSGRHSIKIGDRLIEADKSYTKGGHIRIRIIEIPLAAEIFNKFRR